MVEECVGAFVGLGVAVGEGAGWGVDFEAGALGVVAGVGGVHRRGHGRSISVWGQFAVLGVSVGLLGGGVCGFRG